MTTRSRREFLQGSALAAAAAPVLAVWQSSETNVPAGRSAQCESSSYEVHTTATSPWVPVRILDTERMPWPPPTGVLGWRNKVLFEDKVTKGRLRIIDVPIGGPGGHIHYHLFHEWAYWLTGDFTNNEYTHPDQRVGPFMQYKEGYFLDRPPYSLHGGEKDRLDSQAGGTCLIMEEGGRSVSPLPGEPGYNEEWKQVKQWAVPRIIYTLGSMPWEPEGGVSGLRVKRLVDDQVRGFRAILRWLPGGWNSGQSPPFARPYYFKQAYQFNFVLNGEINVQTYRAPGEKAERIALGKYFYVERPPMSILGLSDGVVSERGGFWLEVTYAKGTSIPNLPVEAPHYV
ncbi:MAG TPA: twin-arginine translocation signal domain-containing protein [Candidatus Dormibacteraeota bacterium]|nr:twin-arginine translocation signal domain-containing protein [Candidatus Dormibacteraeota bacterium]